MKHISEEKLKHLKALSDDNNVISALAIDQRGSLRRMIAADAEEGADIQALVEQFKVAVSEELTPYASSILLDPEYGLPAAKQRDEKAGLLLSYEKTGYDATEPGRLPDLIADESAKRIKEQGGNAVKFLLYFDIDEGDEINDAKKAFVERIGAECEAEGIPFFMEIVTYDAKLNEEKSAEYAKLKPRKVIDAMKLFSEDRYNIDVLKMEVPVNMNYVEGFDNGEVVYTQEEAKAFFKEQSEATDLPFIFLSAGVSAELFQETLKFAKEAGSEFNGVLCGRATWKDAIPEFAEKGEEAARAWLKGQGKENIQALNAVLEETATPWTNRIGK
ncbi:MAG: tagatose-bisphosphate aldolase [Aerococcus sp.]|nr:tagatose-bisphosphate aldolase [Aerococcus sp.]